MHHYYPTRQPILVRDSELRVERRLRAQGEVKVRPGDRVEPSTVVAVGVAPARPVVVNVARELGIEPDKVAERLSKRAGDTVEANEAIAKRRRGLRTHTVKSPFAGTLTGFNAGAGTATIAPAAQRQDLTAYVVGVVEEVEQAWGVTVRTFGSRFHGVFGVGGEAFGVLKVVTKDRQHPLTPELIDSRAARSVLVAGGSVNAAALQRAVQVGAKGVIVGSIEERELRAFLKASGQSLWRVGLPDWRLPALLVAPPLTIVVTEGFGQGAMAGALYETLMAGNGEQVSLNGTTQVAGGLRRPEVLITRGSGRGAVDEGLPVAALVPGTTIRLIDQDHLGIVATVREAPRRRRLGGDLVLEALKVELPNGEGLLLPLANVEPLV